ncbi:hypothetical protein C1646_761200 [Rhizophagus diaphanus]|nr:hypothetical protein C1646_761200 [Rhizophagus diaphanus] [Rhizophagus sp. MUCL 43196]
MSNNRRACANYGKMLERYHDRSKLTNSTVNMPFMPKVNHARVLHGKWKNQDKVFIFSKRQGLSFYRNKPQLKVQNPYTEGISSTFCNDPPISFLKDDINLVTTLPHKSQHTVVKKDPNYNAIPPELVKSMKELSDARKKVEDQINKEAQDWNVNILLYRLCHDFSDQLMQMQTV